VPQPTSPDLPQLAPTVARMDDVAELRETVQGLLELTQDLHDPVPCVLDARGYCMSHSWYERDPGCPHARAKAVLAEAGMEPS
jgi:hypothetical protein